MQDKSKLGSRFTCFQCGLKFYDLNRPEPNCPKCGADQRDNPTPDPREAILAKFKTKAGKPRLEEEAEEEEKEEEVDLSEDEEIEDDEEEGGEELAGGGGDEED